MHLYIHLFIWLTNPRRHCRWP